MNQPIAGSNGSQSQSQAFGGRFAAACCVLGEALHLSWRGQELDLLWSDFQAERRTQAALRAELSIAATRCHRGLAEQAEAALQDVVTDSAEYAVCPTNGMEFSAVRAALELFLALLGSPPEALEGRPRKSSVIASLRAAVELYRERLSPAAVAAATAAFSTTNQALIGAAGAALVLVQEQHLAAAAIVLDRFVLQACKAVEQPGGNHGPRD